jgi:uncharacterized integral membrane protein (TIGR00698 family)
MHTVKALFPGILLSTAVAAAARTISHFFPTAVIGASVIALFLGMSLNHVFASRLPFKQGLVFCSKRILKLAIILLGFSLNIVTIFHVGRLSLLVMVFTLITCFGGGALIGRVLGLNWRLSNLISAGTGICGGSAIAALAPVIGAEEEEISYALSATFLFDMLMVLMFPVVGTMLGLSDMAYGLWTGTAVNDTSSVVAAGYAFSENAGDFAAMVKLTRTLAIIPVVLIFSFHAKLSSTNKRIKKAYPSFIILFIFAALLNSAGLIPHEASVTLKDISSFLMVVSLSAIGLNTNIRNMAKAGFSPLLHGFLISALVVIVAFAVIIGMGMVTFG